MNTSTDARITDVEVIVLDNGIEYGTRLGDDERAGPRHTCLIRVATDAGVEGYGDVDSHPWVVKAIVEAVSHIPAFCAGLRDAAVGQRVWDRTALWERLYQHSWYHGRRGPALHAISGIDVAVWDICGRLSGLPVADLLGGRRRDRVLAYASTLFRATPDEMRAATRSYLDRGFRAIKFGWGPWGSDLTRDRALLAAARAEAGPDVHLMVDGYLDGDYNAVRRFVSSLEDLNPYWIEEPFPADRWRDIARLGRDTGLPVATGEQLAADEFTDLLSEPGIAILQPDLSRCGGFTTLHSLAPRATAAGRRLVPHAWTTPLLTAATAQAAAWLPTPTLLEYNVSTAPITRDLATPLPFHDGHIHLPTTPGLGVTPNPEVIATYRIA
ncbi:mandelate racemase/muconate lactonizing enzyme family protein [Kribbella sandramycini]|uniref:L-alanine-DL-glutamate epimerase-like enolase superfamily enzyme n=1 Tax=Kribbella sandramycini TaxID=60450 RepID=A0A7Y4L1G3_9ACTN|nr:L-alanine-DL-glutamate epimerase-like enolase superfamily enzyme [Kribbella sandramycini]NOL42554.1 mandelate racemase/muconate lactonizing enzyme family protein [Kribbella sandramycini]